LESLENPTVRGLEAPLIVKSIGPSHQSIEAPTIKSVPDTPSIQRHEAPFEVKSLGTPSIESIEAPLVVMSMEKKP